MGRVSMVDGHIDGMTNYDRIRNMSVEDWVKVIQTVEICDQLCAYGINGQCNGVVSNEKKCAKGIKQWLESEVTE